LKYILRSLAALLIVNSCLPAHGFAQTSSQPKKDDLLFRKLTYTDKQGSKMPYRLFVPLGYDASQKYPLVFWLHGAAGRGTDNLLQISGGNENGTHFWTTPEHQAQLRAFVLAPQCPEGHYWTEPETNAVSPQLQTALDILAAVEKEFSIDPDRLYVAGQSMGGMGVWAAVQAQPDRWAAALPLCAFANVSHALVFGRVPFWIFQGDADQVVPVTLVRQMVKDLQKAGLQPRYSEYHGVGHDVWTKAFAEPELFGWVAAQSRATK
jgi:predicted peptidase